MRRPRAQVLLVGSELIGGRKADRNGPLLAHTAEALGHEVSGQFFVPDDKKIIAATISASEVTETSLLLIAGGLGPTSDDLTREAIADALDRDLELDPAALVRIESRYEDRGKEMPEGARRQALVPAGAELIPNPLGSAPGLLVRDRRMLIVALPGVPREVEAMVEREVWPRLRKEILPSIAHYSRVMRVAGLGEAEVAKRVQSVLGNRADLSVSYLASPGEVEVALGITESDVETAQAELDQLIPPLRESLMPHLFDVESLPRSGEGDHHSSEEDRQHWSNLALVRTVEGLLHQHDWTLATAESCTGGLVSRKLTDLPGSSRFFLGGVVVYHDREKEALLGVPRTLLESCGAVSAVVVKAMTQGCRDRLGADVAVATTGIAGPGGGSSDKPVGLVYIGVQTPEQERVTRHLFQGDRWSVRHWTAVAALDEVRRISSGLPPFGQLVEPNSR